MIFLMHPLVVHFPIALWLTSALFDLLYLRRNDPFYSRAAMVLIGLGLLGALVSIASGFRDFLSFKPDEIGQAFVTKHQTHSIVAYGATAVYAASFGLRWRRPSLGKGIIAGFMVLGAALIALTGWFGGEVRLVM
jgi:uncharacterized membrane protein